MELFIHSMHAEFSILNYRVWENIQTRPQVARVSNQISATTLPTSVFQFYYM
jgi:hypothetical protein